ncbi:hypothetical protein HNP48_001339 [Acidovorax soli]|uniref:Uncharacterized protein n=1 Tax=Acidovorax soli TaxID=592050 RepID=A0A7X0U8Q0_9BURK|nr:putative molybdenum carrier protein [Acidovorax soli]MBB6558675.1 hypothetical protein [Acidovorax soli]
MPSLAIIDTRPVLTVLPEYALGAFLWINRDPASGGGIGPNLCDATFWDDSFLMSEGLWRKFADWAMDFVRMEFYQPDVDDRHWDWMAFHARGLQLSHWLKEEVGEQYAVVYLKPFDDPNHRLEERREVPTNGALVELASFRPIQATSTRLCKTIQSGGQTGVDRSALDFAIAHGYTHTGWAPSGRCAEDGNIPFKYQLKELSEGGYRQRNRLNVHDSDATLILNMGELTGGTLATRGFAQKMGKPHLVLQLDENALQTTLDRLQTWLRQGPVQTLNVAGPRESKCPGIYSLARQLLDSAHAQLSRD